MIEDIVPYMIKLKHINYPLSSGSFNDRIVLMSYFPFLFLLQVVESKHFCLIGLIIHITIS